MATYQRMVQAFPGDAEALHDLDAVLLLVGKPGQALPLLERAAALEPQVANYQANL